MFANLKLRRRILFGYSIPIVLFVGLAIPVFSSVAKVQEASRQTKISLNAVEGGTQMAVALAKMARDERGYLATKDESFFADYQNDLQLFREKAEFVSNTLENQEQKERLKKMIELKTQSEKFASELNSLVKANKQAEAIMF